MSDEIKDRLRELGRLDRKAARDLASLDGQRARQGKLTQVNLVVLGALFEKTERDIREGLRARAVEREELEAALKDEKAEKKAAARQNVVAFP